MIKNTALFALVALAPLAARAQAPVWGQCGGIGWSGATTCASGSSCVKQNDYYSQCMPGSSSPPSTTVAQPPSSTVGTTATAGPTTSTTPSADNPFNGYEIFLSPYYADEVAAAASSVSDSSLQSKAASVAKIPTFVWLDTLAKVPDLGTYLSQASAQGKSSGKKMLVQFIVYDLPDRDCAALASNGELSIANDGENKYHGYIDAIVEQVQKYPDVRTVAIVEPDSLANLVTNMNVQKCANAATRAVTYAMQELSKAGVYMYLDAGHAGWLGWPANLTPAAQMFQQLYTGAGSPKFVRGLATNVANYNALSASSPDPVTQGNNNYDEIHYIQALAAVLSPFPAHFIVDQGRSGQQNIRQQWGDWCNVKGAGFGMRPTLNTGSSLIDAIVWAKPGGESDGTSNSSATRYDAHCGQSDAFQPAPEAGTWFQAYFEQLVSKANPPL
ncbi:Beta-glucosidase cel3A [Paramarasmius palmivorus]|uniref:Glucanase n=1 Tax=Paramarasmius palmivorus TaxID=297713 RepID=A0AAW0CP59_9AGAR